MGQPPGQQGVGAFGLRDEVVEFGNVVVALEQHGARADAIRRLDLYKNAVDRIEADVRHLLADCVQKKAVWTAIKTAYSGMICRNDDWELAETFFNSITRRIFSTVGVDPDIQFVETDFDPPPILAESEVYKTFKGQESVVGSIRMILNDFQLIAPFQDFEYDAKQVAEKIET